MVVGFFVSFKCWLSQCWEYRPRRVRCEMCHRTTWVYGEFAPVICSKACEESFMAEIPF